MARGPREPVVFVEGALWGFPLYQCGPREETHFL